MWLHHLDSIADNHRVEKQQNNFIRFETPDDTTALKSLRKNEVVIAAAELMLAKDLISSFESASDEPQK